MIRLAGVGALAPPTPSLACARVRAKEKLSGFAAARASRGVETLEPVGPPRVRGRARERDR